MRGTIHGKSNKEKAWRLQRGNDMFVRQKGDLLEALGKLWKTCIIKSGQEDCVSRQQNDG